MEKYFNLPLFLTLLAFAIALYFLSGMSSAKMATTTTTTTPAATVTA